STNTPNWGNFLIWWDGDLQREILDAVGGDGKNPVINKWYGDGAGRLLSLYNVPSSYATAAINYTKGNPCLSGDILGDWREEAIYRSSDNTQLRIFTTTTVTDYRFYTFMHDSQYRTAVAWQCNMYNQPPHPSFYVGAGMNSLPKPDIILAGKDSSETDPPLPNPMGWEVMPYATGGRTVYMQATAAIDINEVEYYFTCTAGGGHDSGWQFSSTYEDAGLEPGMRYTYTVTARDRSDNFNMTFTSVPASCFTTSKTGLTYWDFEDGSELMAFSNMSGKGSVDIVNGMIMYGYNATYGPSFAAETITGGGLSAYFNGGQDGYTQDAGFNSWSQPSWTIELSVKLMNISGWKTLIGRDGSSVGEVESDFYFQKNGIDNAFRLNFRSIGGARHVLDSDFAAQAGLWYRLAITSDGTEINMYCDKLDGDGYQLVGSLDISAQTPAQNALSVGTFNWTFGRGWYEGDFTDYINGYLDNIRFSNTVLTPDKFLGVRSESAEWLYGDFSGDHIVNLVDFSAFARLWFWGESEYLNEFDIDSDGSVHIAELSALSENWLSEDN
ncbi:MAG: hypothetical protein JXM68_06325, partial [Sedimentisphaerales bacterium]|nr:hypothetical protein [Sedimentisphaerales bacterium]